MTKVCTKLLVTNTKEVMLVHNDVASPLTFSPSSLQNTYGNMNNKCVTCTTSDGSMANISPSVAPANESSSAPCYKGVTTSKENLVNSSSNEDLGARDGS